MSPELERARQELVTRLTWPYKIKSKLVADFERLVREDSNAAPAPAAPLLPALDVAKKLANVGGIDRWEKILQEWLDSYIARWKTEEQIWREPVPAAPLEPEPPDMAENVFLTEEVERLEAELARLTTHIAAQNEVLSALCAKAGVDFTDVEAAKKALDGRTAELEQVKAERDLANRHAADLFKRLQAAEAALREKGE